MNKIFYIKHNYLKPLTPFLIYDNNGNLKYKFNLIQRTKKIFPLGDLELNDDKDKKLLVLKQEKVLGYPFNYLIERNNKVIGKIYSKDSSRLNPRFILEFERDNYQLKIKRKLLFFIPRKINVTSKTNNVAKIERPFAFLKKTLKIDVEKDRANIPSIIIGVLLLTYFNIGTGEG